MFLIIARWIPFSQEASRQRLDDRRLYVEAVQRHEDRKVSERHFREMKTSMEYDNDWLQKIHKGE